MDVVSVAELPNDLAERLRSLTVTDIWFAELEKVAFVFGKSLVSDVSATDTIADVRE